MGKRSFVRAASFRAPKRQVDRLRRALEAGAEVVVQQPDGTRVSSTELSQFPDDRRRGAVRGGELVLLRSDEEVSPAEAAQLLGIRGSSSTGWSTRASCPLVAFPVAGTVGFGWRM